MMINYMAMTITAIIYVKINNLLLRHFLLNLRLWTFQDQPPFISMVGNQNFQPFFSCFILWGIQILQFFDEVLSITHRLTDCPKT